MPTAARVSRTVNKLPLHWTQKSFDFAKGKVQVAIFRELVLNIGSINSNFQNYALIRLLGTDLQATLYFVKIGIIYKNKAPY